MSVDALIVRPSPKIQALWPLCGPRDKTLGIKNNNSLIFCIPLGRDCREATPTFFYPSRSGIWKMHKIV